MNNLVVSTNSQVPFYDTNVFGMIVGFVGSVLIMLITQFILSKRENTRYKKNLILTITQSNPMLFYQILQGSMGNIDYIKLRSELERSNVTYLLAGKLRKDFLELHKIFFTDPNHYNQNKGSIKQHLVNIVNELEKYGDDVLGSKYLRRSTTEN